MTNISVFNFEDCEVRFVGTADKPEWVASDVCRCLEIDSAHVSRSLDALLPDEKDRRLVATPGGEQELLTVTEPGLYRLIFKSRKPVAKRFQQWVIHEVLPSIRQTGSYSLPNITPAPTAQTSENSERTLSVPDQLAIIKYMFDGFQSAGVEAKITEAAKISALEAQFPHMAPAIASAKQSLMLQTPDEGHRYNPTRLGELLARRLGLSQPIASRKVNIALESVGFQVAEHSVNSKGKKTQRWHLTQRGESYGRMFLESAQGHSKTIPVVRWLPSVIDEIAHLFVDQ